MKHPFIPMSKKEYEEKDLLHSTTRIENISYGAVLGKLFPYTRIKALNNLHFKVVGGYHPYNFAGEFRAPVRKLTEFFGFKPTAYHTFSYRTAVWAFTWDSQDILFFKSKRGVSVQTKEDFPPERLKEFYNDLIEVLHAEGHPWLEGKK